jgi:hypothetical protein
MTRPRIVSLVIVCLLTLSAHSLKADVRTDQKSLVKFEGMIGGVMNLFGGKSAREGVVSTVAVKGDRKATLGENTGQIIDLAEEKIYDLDIRRKTYKVTTFAELRRRMEEARKQAAEEARKQEDKASKPQPRDKNEKEMEVDFDVKSTGQTKTINGFNTREVVMTVTVREKGKTLEQSGGLVLTSDLWLAPKIAAMNEISEFDQKYARKLEGPMVAGASAEEMAGVMAMYPGVTQALAKMRTEDVNMDGTPILSTVTIDSVKSAEQMAEASKQRNEDSGAGAPAGVGGMLGGFAKKMSKKGDSQADQKARATFMTTTNEVLKVAAEVGSEVAIPAGFQQK